MDECQTSFAAELHPLIITWQECHKLLVMKPSIHVHVLDPYELQMIIKNYIILRFLGRASFNLPRKIGNFLFPIFTERSKETACRALLRVMC